MAPTALMIQNPLTIAIGDSDEMKKAGEVQNYAENAFKTAEVIIWRRSWASPQALSSPSSATRRKSPDMADNANKTT